MTGRYGIQVYIGPSREQLQKRLSKMEGVVERLKEQLAAADNDAIYFEQENERLRTVVERVGPPPVLACVCFNCGHEWTALSGEPAACPGCK